MEKTRNKKYRNKIAGRENKCRKVTKKKTYSAPTYSTYASEQ